MATLLAQIAAGGRQAMRAFAGDREFIEIAVTLGVEERGLGCFVERPRLKQSIEQPHDAGAVLGRVERSREMIDSNAHDAQSGGDLIGIAVGRARGIKADRTRFGCNIALEIVGAAHMQGIDAPHAQKAG
jgi:hypothetical protein